MNAVDNVVEVVQFKREHIKAAADLSEDGIALAFADLYADQLRFCHTSGAWHQFVGTHWKRDETSLAFAWARDLCREINQNRNDAERFKKASTAGAVERFARTDQRLACTSSTWNRDPWLLGTPGGVVDLRTGTLRKAQATDYITKLTAVAPSDLYPELWFTFLQQATNNDADLTRFLQQVCGYALTADIREHALFYLYGDGGNGKGVFEHTVKDVMGDYAIVAPMDVFTESRGDRHPTELADLAGARLVVAEETEQGRTWAQARIKSLTGGDPVKARFMRQDFFEFAPTWKLLFVGNHQPSLRNVDDATRRRFNVVPFTNKPPKPDKTLEERLKAELPGILQWMIDGCLDWQKNGLVRPEVVRQATAEYFDAQDQMAQWITDRCELAPAYVDTNGNLFKSWKAYAEANGLHPGKSQTLAEELVKRSGLERIKDKYGLRGRGFRGIRVRHDTEPPWWNQQ